MVERSMMTLGGGSAPKIACGQAYRLRPTVWATRQTGCLAALTAVLAGSGRQSEPDKARLRVLSLGRDVQHSQDDSLCNLHTSPGEKVARHRPSRTR